MWRPRADPVAAAELVGQEQVKGWPPSNPNAEKRAREGCDDSEFMTLQEVVERTGMSTEMIDHATQDGLFPGEQEGGWLRREIEEFMEGLGTGEDLALGDGMMPGDP